MLAVSGMLSLFTRNMDDQGLVSFSNPLNGLTEELPEAPSKIALTAGQRILAMIDRDYAMASFCVAIEGVINKSSFPVFRFTADSNEGQEQIVELESINPVRIESPDAFRQFLINHGYLPSSQPMEPGTDGFTLFFFRGSNLISFVKVRSVPAGMHVLYEIARHDGRIVLGSDGTPIGSDDVVRFIEPLSIKQLDPSFVYIDRLPSGQLSRSPYLYIRLPDPYYWPEVVQKRLQNLKLSPEEIEKRLESIPKISLFTRYFVSIR